MEDELGLYDSNFSLYEMAKSPSTKSFRTSNTGSTEVGRNTSFEESIFDEDFFPNISVNWGEEGDSLEGVIKENRAQNQPWISKFGAGIGRVGSKVVSEILKMPGVLGGIVAGGIGQLEDAVTGKDNTDFMKVAFDNVWINAIGDAEHALNDAALPVHVKRAVEDGDLWDKISAIDFWATDGADGLGYVISMLAPGAAINKFSVGSKLLGVSKAAQMSKSTEKAVGVMGKLGITNKNADLFAATVANTLFEAGAEAKGAMDSYDSQLEYRRSLPVYHPDAITESQFQELSERRSEIGANVFGANAIILLGPNAMMAKMLWGKPRNKGIGALFNKEGRQEIAKRSVLHNAKLYGDDFGIAALREGFWEEGMQSSAEQYLTGNPNKNLGDFIGDFGKAYANMLGTTDGQTAIFLGAAYGGGMQASMGGNSRVKERKASNKLINGAANSVLTDLYTIFSEDIYVKDEEGNVVYDDVTGEEIKDVKKIKDKILANDAVEALSLQYDLAVENNDKETIKQIKDIVSTHVIKPFIVNGELGLDALKQHLENSQKMADIAEKEGTSKDTFVKDIMDKATSLQEKYDNFQDFAPRIIKLNNREATKQDKVDFYNKLSMQYVDQHARKLLLEKELEESAKGLEKLLEEKGRTQEEYDTNRLLQEELNLDQRVGLLGKKVDNLKKSIKQTDANLEAFWDGKSANEYFKKEVAEKIKLQAEEKKKEEVDEVIQKIKAAKTVEELEGIESPDSIASSEIESQKALRREELIAEKEAKNAETIDSNVEFEQTAKEKQNKKENELNYITDNFNVGETIPLSDDLSTEADSGVIKEINDKEVTVLLSNGETVIISHSDFFADNYSPENSYSTEGGTTGPQTVVLDPTSGNVFEDKNHAKVISTNEKTGYEKFDWIDQAAVDWERSPRDKTDEKKGFSVNTSEGLSDNQQLAVDMFNKRNEEDVDINFLIDHLPLNIQLTDDIVAPIETKSKNEAFNKIFNKTTRHLRATIIKEIINNNVELSSIAAPVSGQWNGTIQLEAIVNNKAIENPLAGLYEFGGDIANIKSEDFYIVDDLRVLKNINGEFLPASRPLAVGEIYLRISMANGRDFPLKLNVKKIEEDQADVLYDLYQYRFADISEGKSTRISEIDAELLEKVKTVLAKEVKLFADNKIGPEDLTIKDIVDFLVWDGSRSPKSQIRFYKEALLVAGKTFSLEEFNTPEGKSEFIHILTSEKRHNIKFKRTKTEGVNSMNLQNRSYLEYLLNNTILNTNAKIGEPTFAGKTNIYLYTDKVEVAGTLSEFNKNVPKTYTKKLIGTDKMMETKIPGINTNPVALNPTEEFYVDEKGVKHERVSTLKDSAPNMNQDNVYNAAKRGNVVDELVRLFYETTSVPLAEFIKRGHTYVAKQNKLKDRTSIVMSNSYFEELYNILEEYKIEFDRLGLTIYSNTPSLSGKIGSKGNYAGTMDLLAFDNINNKWIVIDLKTSTKDRADYYSGKINDISEYKKKDEIQQNAYRELFFQKTGRDAAELWIMPLTSTADDAANTTYTSISRSSQMFLKVDTSRSIFEILKITQNSTPKRGAIDMGQIGIEANPNISDNDGTAGAVESGIDLDNLGLDLPKKPTPKVSPKGEYVLSEAEQVELSTQLQAGEFIQTTINGKLFLITPGTYYVVNQTDSAILTNLDTIKGVIKHYNLENNVIIEINKVEKAWNSRLNVVPLQNKKEITNGIDFNSITVEQAQAGISKIIQFYSNESSLKDIQRVMGENKNSSMQNKFKALFELMEAKNVSTDELIVKCGL
tara:strand:+ start:20907 stop:26249 length:5343 start_codon:yes stop_codon:yes gene_type:complete